MTMTRMSPSYSCARAQSLSYSCARAQSLSYSCARAQSLFYSCARAQTVGEAFPIDYQQDGRIKIFFNFDMRFRFLLFIHPLAIILCKSRFDL